MRSIAETRMFSIVVAYSALLMRLEERDGSGFPLVERRKVLEPIMGRTDRVDI